jgi:predicted Rdx family selenoprotein
MHKIWFGLAFAAIMANPALAQDYQKNFAECVKELGLHPDTGYAQKVQSEGGRVLHRWYFQSDAQAAAFNDCVARKASLAPKPSGKGRASR